VRLKGGDPFLFGRGGEEALALRAAGIRLEVVPGVSSAVAAPELAGIPVTHRGVAAAVSIVSGHAETAYGPVIDSLAPGSSTLVILMGVTMRGAIADRLVGRGWPATTPAAVVSAAGQSQASLWIGTVATLGTAEIDADLPGTIVIGDVVRLSSQIGGVIATAPRAIATPVARYARDGKRG
jgi:siroheme synthase